MDFETLLTIALIVFYFVAQVAGRRKRPGQQPNRPAPQRRPPPPPEPQPSPSDAEYDLDEALREIRTALGFPEAEEQPRPKEKTTPSPPVSPPLPAPPHPLEARPPARPAPVEIFEHARGPVEFIRPEMTPIDGVRPLAEKESASSMDDQKAPVPFVRSEILNRLRNPQDVREAVLLAEVLGPPRARRHQ